MVKWGYESSRIPSRYQPVVHCCSSNYAVICFDTTCIFSNASLFLFGFWDCFGFFLKYSIHHYFAHRFSSSSRHGLADIVASCPRKISIPMGICAPLDIAYSNHFCNWCDLKCLCGGHSMVGDVWPWQHPFNGRFNI